jgi:hypothetical protein
MHVPFSVAWLRFFFLRYERREVQIVKKSTNIDFLMRRKHAYVAGRTRALTLVEDIMLPYRIHATR